MFGNRLRRLTYYPREVSIAILLVVSLVAVPGFGEANNLKNLLAQASPLLLLAIGQTFVLLVGGIDLTQGALVGLASVLLFVLFGVIGPVGSIVATAAGCALLSFLLGVLIAKLRIDPLIATLAGMYVLMGSIMWWTGGTPITEAPVATARMLKWLGTASIGFVPVSFIVASVLAVAAYGFLRHLMIGLHIYATGSNPRAAAALGINRTFVFGVAYALCSLFTVAGSLLLTARIQQGNPHLGEGLLFESIGSAVLGGVLLSGGTGGVWAVVRGVALLALLQNSLYLTDLNSYVRDIALGVLIVTGVLLARMQRSGESK